MDLLKEQQPSEDMYRGTEFTKHKIQNMNSLGNLIKDNFIRKEKEETDKTYTIKMQCGALDKGRK